MKQPIISDAKLRLAFEAEYASPHYSIQRDAFGDYFENRQCNTTLNKDWEEWQRCSRAIGGLFSDKGAQLVGTVDHVGSVMGPAKGMEFRRAWVGINYWPEGFDNEEIRGLPVVIGYPEQSPLHGPVPSELLATLRLAKETLMLNDCNTPRVFAKIDEILAKYSEPI